MRVHVFLILCCLKTVVLQRTGSGNGGNLRLCIVEGLRLFKRAPTHCPVLDKEKAGVECVLGTDRLDCLRRISKGTVDFGVFSPEDLVAAQWANIDVLVTNEIRFRSKPFARKIVAVVNKRILPDTSTSIGSILRNSTLCHPGETMDDLRPISETLSGYLESLILERSCDPKLSNTENKLKSLASFYGKACKAGPWVPDSTRNKELKLEYPSLCAACHSRQCAVSDRYWGNLGSLNCLHEGGGDVTWGEADDVAKYFKLTESTPLSGSDNFAYLCRDGTWYELSEEPCVWLTRPWNVIVAKRKASEAVVHLARSLTNSSIVDGHWPSALAALLETNQGEPEELLPARTPVDYLSRAYGFVEAYNQAGCDPPRHIKFCTTSLLAKNKCEWLSEAGAVYGIVPPLKCLVRESTEQCLRAVESGESDVAVADSDYLVSGIRDYSLTPVLHEMAPLKDNTYTIVALVKNNTINKMSDLRGKRAAFPRYDGFSWHSVRNFLNKTQGVSCSEFESYFSEICAPGLDGKKCYEAGDGEALKSLIAGKSDVAFISMETYKIFKASPGDKTSPMSNIIPLCPDDNQRFCFLSWSNLGHIFVANNQTSVHKHEIVNVFTKLDQIFGKHPPFHNPMFSMYGTYNHEMEVIFKSKTRNLGTDIMLVSYPYDKIPFNFELSVANITKDYCSFGAKLSPSLIAFLIASLVVFFVSS